jgi:pimeloyl-ACP methyl ester carboxylesterase
MPKKLKLFYSSSLLVLLSAQAQAYDPCNVKNSFNSLAESFCKRIETPVSPENKEVFKISGVLLTKTLKTFKEKTTVVLIPGGPGSDSQSIRLSFNQKDLINAFWAHLNVNVVLYDPRGTGSSQLFKNAEHYSYNDFTTSLQVSDLDKVVDAFSPDSPVVLLAHSAGGNTAAKYASQFPDKVRGLVLYSASLSNREIGLSNLRIFSDDFDYFRKHISTCGANALSLESRRINIETFLKNSLKLIRIGKVRPKGLATDFYLKNFRTELISAVENDFNCSSRIDKTLRKWENKILILPEDVKLLVFQQSSVLFDYKAHIPPTIKRSSWIKTALICSEGLTYKDYSSSLWLEGLNFSHDTCSGFPPVFGEAQNLNWTQKIEAPTLLLGGTEDPFQLPSFIERNAALIKNSRVHMFKDAGHEAHLSHSFEFFKTIEDFLIRL